MAAIDATLRLAAFALGTLGAALIFVEFFQLPSYVDYKPQMGTYNLEFSPDDAREYTWAGRIGALLVAIAFALQFVAGLL